MNMRYDQLPGDQEVHDKFAAEAAMAEAMIEADATVNEYRVFRGLAPIDGCDVPISESPLRPMMKH